MSATTHRADANRRLDAALLVGITCTLVALLGGLALSALGVPTMNETVQSGPSMDSPDISGLTPLGPTIDWNSLKTGDTVPLAAFSDPTPRPESTLPLDAQERLVGSVDRLTIPALPKFKGGRCYPDETHAAVVPMVRSAVVRNRVQVPPTNQVGWVSTTAQPGARRGVSMLAGHLTNGPRGADTGPLWGAECLRRGSEINVVWHGRELTYKVTAVTKHERDDLPSTVVDPNGPNRIALITCTGPYTYNKSNRQFWLSRNAIIWAEQVR